MAIDPGVTTGIATYTPKFDSYYTYEVRFSNFLHPHKELYDYLQGIAPDFIIYEAFHYRQGQLGAEFVGIEYIGVVELWCQQNQIPKYKITPSDGKGFWNLQKIKTVGLWSPRKQEMDAVKLLLTYLMKFHAEWKSRYIEKLRPNPEQQ